MESLLTEDEKTEIEDLQDKEIHSLADQPVRLHTIEGVSYTDLQGQRVLYARYLVDLGAVK